MPSWCENRITITTETEDKMAEVLAALRGPNGPFDFEAIRPAPVVLQHGVRGDRSFEGEGQTVTVERWLERRDGKGAVLEARPFTAAEIAEFRAQPHATLFDWRCAEWGCKWPAQDVDLDDDGETATLQFDTPWDPPPGIIKALRERFPDIHISAFFDVPDMEEAGHY